MAASAKEECFENAWKKYEKTFQGDMKVDVHESWGLLTDGTWTTGYRGFWHAVNSFRKWFSGRGGKTVQVRVPDLTIDHAGQRSVLDLKFTRADGTVDDWREDRIGKGSFETQREDYRRINRQLNNGNAQYGDDPKLDPDKCRCDQPNGTRTAPIRVFYDEYSDSFSVEDFEPLRPRLGPIRLPRPAPNPWPGRLPGGGGIRIPSTVRP